MRKTFARLQGSSVKEHGLARPMCREKVEMRQ
jgi:hypothetical protein